MKMPIVSLNQMAMNESIAATCCFAIISGTYGHYEFVAGGGGVPEPHGFVKKILHGGYLGEYQAGPTWRLKEDVVAYTNNGFLQIKNDYGTDAVAVYVDGTWKLDGTFTPLTGGTGCTHIDKSKCMYYDRYTPEAEQDMHINATAAHSWTNTGSTTGWDKPHKAAQFLS